MASRVIEGLKEYLANFVAQFSSDYKKTKSDLRIATEKIGKLELTNQLNHAHLKDAQIRYDSVRNDLARAEFGLSELITKYQGIEAQNNQLRTDYAGLEARTRELAGNLEISQQTLESERRQKELYFARADELGNLVAQLKTVVKQERRKVKNELDEFFKEPPFNKVAVVLTANNGEIFYQSPQAGRYAGMLRGKNASQYLDLSKTGKQKVELVHGTYNCFVHKCSDGSYQIKFRKPSFIGKLVHRKPKDPTEVILERAKRVAAQAQLEIDERLRQRGIEN